MKIKSAQARQRADKWSSLLFRALILAGAAAISLVINIIVLIVAASMVATNVCKSTFYSNSVTSTLVKLSAVILVVSYLQP